MSAGAWAASPGDPDYRSGGPHGGLPGPTDAQALRAHDMYVLEPYYTTREIAKEFGISQPTAWRWVQLGRDLHWEGESTGKGRRREVRRDADTRIRARLRKVAQDIEAARVDRLEGYKLELAYEDRLIRLYGAEAPRRIAAKGKVSGDVGFALDHDVAAQIARMDPHELRDPANDQEGSP